MVKTRAQTPALLTIALLAERNVFSCSVLKQLKLLVISSHSDLAETL